MDLHRLNLIQIRDQIKAKKITAHEVVTNYLEQINKKQSINAYVTINECAQEEARKVDRQIQKGETLGRLAGVPIAVKDLFCTKGLLTTACSRMLSEFIPPYTATCIQRLQDEGAIVIGKTSMDEFAMGSSNETSFFKPVKNPWNEAYVPGGSSGGSAAAVAGNMAAAAIGSDTGGSVRQPAHFCGLVGVKPTYGRISRYGMIAFASSLDQAGPMTKTVSDSMLLSSVMSGLDNRDGTTADVPPISSDPNTLPSLSALRIGVLKYDAQIDSETQEAMKRSLSALKESGATIVDISVDTIQYAVSTYYLIAMSEASSNLSRYDGVRFGHQASAPDEGWSSLSEFYSKTRGEGFGAEVKRRVLMGAYALSQESYEAYYMKASQVRRKITNDFENAFRKCDVILSPVATAPAFKLGERIEDPLQMYMNDLFTTSANLAGLPAMSVPIIKNKLGLPIGVQLMAAPFKEVNIFTVAQELERVFDFWGFYE